MQHTTQEAAAAATAFAACMQDTLKCKCRTLKSR